MFKKIMAGLAVFAVAFVIIVATRPSDFKITRSAVMAAPPEAVFSQVNDFHKWDAWSPWAKLDPAAKNSFEGASSGVGAIFRWDGNKDVGAGAMTIEESVPSSLIRIKLEFLKPFKGTNATEFTFVPEGSGTRMTWTMSGKNNFMAKAIGLFIDCDKMVGGMFEKGMANLKAIVEAK